MDAAEKIGRAYELLQNLVIQPTRSNVDILSEALGLMQQAYEEMKGESAHERPQADIDGWNDN